MEKYLNLDELKEFNASIDYLLGQVANCKTIFESTTEEMMSIKFISSEEFAEIYGCSKKNAQKIFALPDFPSSDFGKEKKAELTAVKKYFQRHIEKAHLKYWDTT